MRLRRKIIAGVFSAVTLAGAGIGIGAAHAGTTDESKCRQGAVCVYGQADFTGINLTLNCVDGMDFVAWNFDNSASSVINHCTNTVCLYDNRDRTGAVLQITAGRVIPTLSDETLDSGTWDDKAALIHGC